ncbi:hypothetical protein J4E93_007733 [Alternaria ventricosa]|uniref:uncharacterized protein n=1 Tax=Alternaria ventricosa TaxID=1187951 RepID=UPI0020C267EC|nr:uncharacterized protein J4E93_007733 [Alternaria ventricosa]KAI4641635.1 hypothetical protein J4E93_007733 [Alternaria ventricosa]
MSEAVHSIAKEGDRSHDSKGDFPIDEAVLRTLPEGSNVLSSNRHGFSDWTVTARLVVLLPDGVEKKYFLKIATEEAGRVMMEGEYNSIASLYEISPDFVPKPHTWGKFKLEAPETYFFLCDFIDMTNTLPEPTLFCAKLAQLHKFSRSPTGMFGSILGPKLAQFLHKAPPDRPSIEKKENEPWPAYEATSARVLSHVIPRLLGALEENGRQIKPSLIHGDLWEGNVATDVSNGNIYIFDAGAYYAHHEMDLGMWRYERYEFAKKAEYKQEYLRVMGVDEPVEEFDDRNRLYCVKMNVVRSAHHPGCEEREM